ncbi:hypothetical protein [Lactobacillus sp. PV012]|uniref:hypothetical protein n=1 Tax=Lactobacillus sp. PV012 TaxID=2594494 RepID=UPI002240207D|nr:hypothetical protein [Lactobacillus sp. PV012]QNQ81687.1 hypothetical protein FP433_00790 [Lactobacillus sp. PV012]
MKLRKTVISLVSLLSVGTMFASNVASVQAATVEESYPALAKAEDAPTNPAASQAPKGKHVTKKSKKTTKKHAKKHAKKTVKRNVRK